jgi:4-hydroxy-4-methyl-2-oxoglutarate aldolase
MARWAALSSATVHEAAKKIGALPAFIKPLLDSTVLTGTALPVLSPPGDNLWLHRAIDSAEPGDVLVVDTKGGIEFGYWGEVMAVAAQARGIAGIVIAGGVRDSQRLRSIGFPVFAGAICIRGTDKNPNGKGSVGQPIEIGGIVVRLGDFVLGDSDGVVIIPAELAEEVIGESERRDAQESAILTRLRAGESTMDIYNLPRESA